MHTSTCIILFSSIVRLYSYRECWFLKYLFYHDLSFDCSIIFLGVWVEQCLIFLLSWLMNRRNAPWDYFFTYRSIPRVHLFSDFSSTLRTILASSSGSSTFAWSALHSWVAIPLYRSMALQHSRFTEKVLDSRRITAPAVLRRKMLLEFFHSINFLVEWSWWSVKKCW